MRTKLSVLLLLLVVASCTWISKDRYFVKCKFEGVAGGWAYLQKQGDGQWIKFDSAEIKKGKFHFKGKITSPEYCFLAIDGVDGTFGFFLDHSFIKIKGYATDLEHSEIKGSDAQEEYNAFLNDMSSLENQNDQIYSLYRKAKDDGDQENVYKYKAQLNDMDVKMTTAIRDYIVKNPKTIVSPFLVTSNFWRFELKDLQDFKAGFDKSLGASDYLKVIDKRIEVLKKVENGQPAPEFSMNDSTGTPVSLSSYKGKIVLVDFWASWCPDCRVENPNVVKMFNEYHGKGLEILGVSLDRDRSSWIEAIKKDNLTWKHVSDLKDWDNTVAKLYGVMAIPANVLVDKDGTIIGRNLYGDALKNKLAEIFK